MNITVRVSTTQKGSAEQWLADFERRMKGPTAVKVGFPSGTDASVVEYAIYNHFGTSGRTPRRGGWGGPIPARPFITAAVFKHRSQIRRMLAAAYRAILSGHVTSEQALERIAQFGVGIIQDTIRRGMSPANAALTIKLKGSGKNTLNNEGRMRASVTWQFDRSSGGQFRPGPRRTLAAQRRALR